MIDVVAFIAERGGSKGIPRKNVRSVAGRPLPSWTIEAARAVKRVGRMVVSTYNADIVIRPAAIAGDGASVELLAKENPRNGVYLQALAVREPA